jgi:hypothetical protein
MPNIIKTYAEYTAASPEVRAAFDAAREAKKVAYRLANADQEAEAEARAELAEKLSAKRDAVFLTTGNRDVYDLPVPSSSNLGWAHDEAVMQDYKRRKAIVETLLSDTK